MPYSTCCGAYTDMEEYGICPECKEHCDFEEEEDEEDEPMCQACNGTGEGQYSDSTCNVCKGKG